MRLSKLLMILAMASIFGIYSCGEDDKAADPNAIPDDAMEFQSADQVKQIVLASLGGVSGFVENGKGYLSAGSKASFAKPGSAQDESDTTYYNPETGWWINEGMMDYDEDGNNYSLNINNQFQFLSEDQPQRLPFGADAMHTIMDLTGNFSFSGEGSIYNFDLKYFLDLMYSNLQSKPIQVDGTGIYDYIISITGQQNQRSRIYFKYTLEELKVPDDGYPSGKMIMETIRWAIEIIFNGTDKATLRILDNGNLAGSEVIDLDEDV